MKRELWLWLSAENRSYETNRSDFYPNDAKITRQNEMWQTITINLLYKVFFFILGLSTIFFIKGNKKWT